MIVCGKEIKDECANCGLILECELFRLGHGIKTERSKVREMVECQINHKNKRLRNE